MVFYTYLKSNLFYFGSAVVFGAAARLLNLVLFLGTIRLIVLVYQGTSSSALNISEELMIDSNQQITMIGVGIFLSFVLAAWIEFLALKFKKSMIFRALEDFEKDLAEKHVDITKLAATRALNTFRLAVDALINVYLMLSVVVVAFLALMLFNPVIGTYLFVGLLGVVTIFALVLRFIGGRARAKLVLDLTSKLPKSRYQGEGPKSHSLGSLDSAVEQKYVSANNQVLAIILQNLILGLCFALMVFLSGNSAVSGFSLFDVVVLLYTLRFISVQSRNAIVNYIRFSNSKSLTIDHLKYEQESLHASS